ncbi:hypothetical protein C8R43DRAFT_945039 [Mycena crocata]|nr:hypothetical protein C8R43DRAFT_945039 [Mycena crocata]
MSVRTTCSCGIGIGGAWTMRWAGVKNAGSAQCGVQNGGGRSSVVPSPTTVTTTYILDKYSRAYSPNCEWQHFTNPVLRLILNAPTTTESFRLRVVWMDHLAQQDVVLEDLDLGAFSTLKDESDTPIKGVYHDTTFALRYLHVSTSAGSDPQKFQVSFPTHSAVLQLADAMRDVCPCRPRETNPQSLNRSKTVAILKAPSARVPSPMQQVAAPSPMFTSSPVLLVPSPSQPEPVKVFPAASFHLSSDRAPRASPLPSSSQPAVITPLSSLPDSSPAPSCSAESAMPLSTPSPGNAEIDTHADVDMVDVLREATGLYDLSHSELERLVGDVVHENRFVELLENMSSMWAVKAVM